MIFLYVFLCFTSYIGGERFKDPRSLSNDEYPQPISLITTTDRIFMCQVKLSKNISVLNDQYKKNNLCLYFDILDINIPSALLRSIIPAKI